MNPEKDDTMIYIEGLHEKVQSLEAKLSEARKVIELGLPAMEYHINLGDYDLPLSESINRAKRARLWLKENPEEGEK